SFRPNCQKIPFRPGIALDSLSCNASDVVSRSIIVGKEESINRHFFTGFLLDFCLLFPLEN
ncbi:MAG: hypothetical protein IKN90_02445, partial [Treponema sp.]|nr:hypothetical protein [Treponema sp.]